MTAPVRKRPLRLERQLDDSKNKGYDCGRAVAVMEVDYASSGRIRPTTEQIGWRMKRRTGPSNDGDREQALESYDKEARRRGLRGLKVRRYAHSQPLPELWKWLQLGRPVGVAIDYGEVADYKNPDYEDKHFWSSKDDGNGGFRGYHAVWLRRARVRDGKREVQVFDPLADGRSLGGGRKAVRGPRWWPWELVRDALEGVWGRGNWRGTVGRRAVLLEDVEPSDPEENSEPDPLDPPGTEEVLAEALAVLERVAAGQDPELAAQARVAIVAIDAIMPPGTSTTEPTSGVELEDELAPSGLRTDETVGAMITELRC